jgi:D-alanyl-lipoteichoic acid acyltransferase DltB (MBOAT superfamily)
VLFNSYEFIFVFLPVALLGYYLLAGAGWTRPAMAWLALASLVFYGYWAVEYLWLLLASITGNYLVGARIGRGVHARAWLVFGVGANLGLLAYYKYAHFIAFNVSVLANERWRIEPIALPLAISFFTFTQIAYLVDRARGVPIRGGIGEYALFVLFFPHLIAGPIVHHAEIMPQFARSAAAGKLYSNLAVGLALFALGLFKKSVIADAWSGYATPIFAAADAGETLTLAEGWGAALAYTLQIYFDFSGYSDMALGLARMFGIRFPLNFDSPYQARDIADFWRRWHMTLSRFLRQYLYIPLGGNRRGRTRTCVNLFATMAIGGLWHGAAWTFVVWGALHGLYLLLHRAWRGWRERHLPALDVHARGYRCVSWSLTFLAVVGAWVVFRAQTLAGAGEILAAMAGLNGFAVEAHFAAKLGDARVLLTWLGVDTVPDTTAIIGKTQLVNAVLLLGFCALAPNTQTWIHRARPALTPVSAPRHPRLRALCWRPRPAWAAATAAVFVYATLQLTRVSEFLYWRF